jgi:hypothetical protein
MALTPTACQAQGRMNSNLQQSEFKLVKEKALFLGWLLVVERSEEFVPSKGLGIVWNERDIRLDM